MFTLIILLCIIFLIAALPLKNWLEVEQVRKKDAKWTNWLLEKPSRDEYCLKTNQTTENIKCDYCDSNRQLPSLEMVITYQPKFGLISNSFQKHSYFKTYICSGCGAQLYRERYEE